MWKNSFFFFVIGSLCFASVGVAETKVTNEAKNNLLVIGKEKGGVVYLREGASWAEKYAGEELIKYLNRITEVKSELTIGLPVQVSQNKTSILVGKMSGKDFQDVLERLSIPLPKKEILDNQDAFLVCARDNLLVLAGTSDRSTLYAVYDFLEKEAGIGFFRIAEYIPKSPSLEIKHQYRIEKPYFKYRMFETDSGTSCHYSNWANSREDWVWNVEYRIKKKLNPFYFSYGAYPIDEVMQDFGVDYRWEDRNGMQMGEFIASELKKRGVTFIASLSEGSVQPEFAEKYPEAKYIDATWVGTFKNRYLHPNDPLFDRYVSSFIKHYKANYGSIDSFCFSPYDEKVFGSSQEERREILTSLAKRMGEIINREDPKANVSFHSWAFHNRAYWTNEIVKDFFNAIPSGTKLVIVDFASNVSPFYKETNYFWGKDWIYGFYYQDGPDSYLRQDIGGIITEIQDINSNHGNCVGIYMVPEVTEPNEVMAELGCQLGWNPNLTRKEFLDSYIFRRYGKDSFKTMRQVWETLADTVYGEYGSCEPRQLEGCPWSSNYAAEPKYHFRLGTSNIGGREITFSGYVEEMERREKVLPALKKAIALALQEINNQSGSLLYYQDIFEVTRQFIVELFNQNLMRAEMAFVDKDKEAFKKYSENALYCLDLQVQLHKSMYSWPEFSFSALTSKGKSALMGNRPWGDIVRWMAGLQGDKINTPLADYWRMDKYESLKYYYQPRIQAYLAFLQKRMDAGDNALPSPQKPETISIRDSFYFGNSIGYPSWELKGDLSDLYADIGLKFATMKGWTLGSVENFRSDNPIPEIQRIMEDVNTKKLLASATEPQILTEYTSKGLEKKTENLMQNPDFEKDMDGWYGSKESGDTVVTITQETRDTNNNSAGALRIKITAGDKPVLNYQGGVRGSLKKEIAKGTGFSLSFYAKSVNGSATISIARPHGGSVCAVQHITKDWQRYEIRFTGENSLAYSYPISEIIFSAISSQRDGFYNTEQKVSDSEFLIDDVSVSVR